MRNTVILLIVALSLYQCRTGEPSSTTTTKQSVQPVNGKLIGHQLDEIEKKQDEFGKLLEFDVIETLTLDLNNDTQQDIIKIERIRQWGDPGDFHKVTVNISGKEEKSFLNTSGWVAIGDYETQFVKDFSSLALITSKYTAVQQASDNDILLFCFGYTYASQPGLLSIINLSMHDGPRLILNDNYYLYAFDDTNNDDNKDITVSVADRSSIKEESVLPVYELISGWLFKKQGQ